MMACGDLGARMTGSVAGVVAHPGITVAAGPVPAGAQCTKECSLGPCYPDGAGGAHPPVHRPEGAEGTLDMGQTLGGTHQLGMFGQLVAVHHPAGRGHHQIPFPTGPGPGQPGAAAGVPSTARRWPWGRERSTSTLLKTPTASPLSAEWMASMAVWGKALWLANARCLTFASSRQVGRSWYLK